MSKSYLHKLGASAIKQCPKDRICLCKDKNIVGSRENAVISIFSSAIFGENDELLS